MAALPSLPTHEDLCRLHNNKDFDAFILAAEQILEQALDLSRYYEVYLLLMMASCANTSQESDRYFQRTEAIYAFLDKYGDRRDPEVEAMLSGIRDDIDGVRDEITREWTRVALRDLAGGSAELVQYGIEEEARRSPSSNGKAGEDEMNAVAGIESDGAGGKRNDEFSTPGAVDSGKPALSEIANAALADPIGEVARERAEGSVTRDGEVEQIATGLVAMSMPGLSSIAVRKKASGTEEASEIDMVFEMGESQLSSSQRRRQMLAELETKLEENEAERNALLREKMLVEQIM
nr:hypothetical protein B0A51_16528 [Rachicladosporium sp. CCFEE 5018]